MLSKEQVLALEAGATHCWMNHLGHLFYGKIVADSSHNNQWMLCLCGDLKTWMKEPILVPSPLEIYIPENELEEE